MRYVLEAITVKMSYHKEPVALKLAQCCGFLDMKWQEVRVVGGLFQAF